MKIIYNQMGTRLSIFVFMSDRHAGIIISIRERFIVLITPWGSLCMNRHGVTWVA